MNTFDHESGALSDIAARPEVTGDMPEQAEKKPLKIAMAAEALPMDDARNGRLLAGTVASSYKALKGQEVEKDRLAAVEEVGAHFFSIMREFGLPRPLYIGILGVILIAPVIPPMISIFKPKTEGKPNVGGN